MSGPATALLILLCLVGTGLFAGLETGVISINRLRLKHRVREGVRGARTLERFLEDPDLLLGTTLLGTNLCMVTASVMAASLADRYLGTWGALVSGVTLTGVILVGCEYLPKAWFQGHPFERTRPFAGFLNLSGKLLLPVTRVVMALTRVLFPAPSRGREPGARLVSKEEIKHLAHEITQSGELTPDERKMVHAALELTHKSAVDIMTPRDKMRSIPHRAPATDALALARQRPFSRVPVLDETRGSFVGILHVLDVLFDRGGEGKMARDYARPVQVIDQRTPADELLPIMRAARQPVVLVTGEGTEVVGMITAQDLLDEIVGVL